MPLHVTADTNGSCYVWVSFFFVQAIGATLPASKCYKCWHGSVTFKSSFLGMCGMFQFMEVLWFPLELYVNISAV